ncbi:MAG: MFS transporter [Candidatus Dojkabacteria bacterium]
MSKDAQKSENVDKSKGRALPIVFLTVFIDLMGFSIVIPILAPLLVLPTSFLLPAVSQSDRLIIFGFLIASYAIAQFIATPILGQLSDRYGRKPLLGISLIGTFVSRIMFILGIASAINGTFDPNVNMAILFLSRIIDGITGGNISIAQSSVADISTPDNRAKNFGILGAAFGLGFIIGPYLGGKFGESGIVTAANNVLHLPNLINSSTLPLWFAALLCLVNIFSLYAIFPETIKAKVKSKLNLSIAFTNTVAVFKIPSLRIIFITIFLLTLGFNFFTQFFAVYFDTNFQTEIQVRANENLAKGDIVITNIPKEILDIPFEGAKNKAIVQYKEGVAFQIQAQKETADVFSFIGICSVISQGLIAGLLSKRFKPATLFKWGIFVNGITTLLFLAVDRTGLLLITIPIFAASNGLIMPNSSALVSNSADEKSQGVVLGGSQSIQALAQAIPPIVSGFIASKLSIDAPIITGGTIILVSFFIFFVFYKEKEKTVLHEA